MADAEGSSDSRTDGGTVVGVGEGGGVGGADVLRPLEGVAPGVGSLVALVVPEGVTPPLVVAGPVGSGRVGVGLGSGASVVGVVSTDEVGLVDGCGR